MLMPVPEDIQPPSLACGLVFKVVTSQKYFVTSFVLNMAQKCLGVGKPQNWETFPYFSKFNFLGVICE